MSNQSTSSKEKSSPGFIMDGAREIIAMTNGAIRIEKQVDALEECIESNPSLALDLSKSLVETACKTILIDRGITLLKNNPTLNELMNGTLAALELNDSYKEDEADVVKHLRSIAKGLVSSFQGLGELRNKKGFASHGHDAYLDFLEPAHALFAARAADAITHFLFSAHRNYGGDLQRKDGQLTIHQRELKAEVVDYEAHQSFNEYIDNLYKPTEIFELQYSASEILAKVDPKAYIDYLAEFDQDKVSNLNVTKNTEGKV